MNAVSAFTATTDFLEAPPLTGRRFCFPLIPTVGIPAGEASAATLHDGP